MSELTLCNYCRLKFAENKAKKEGKFIKKVRGTEDVGSLGLGYNIHILSEENGPISEENFAAWMAEISEKCEC